MDYLYLFDKINERIKSNPELSITQIIEDVCFELDVDSDDYWKWLIYNKKTHFKK